MFLCVHRITTGFR